MQLLLVIIAVLIGCLFFAYRQTVAICDDDTRKIIDAAAGPLTMDQVAELSDQSGVLIGNSLDRLVRKNKITLIAEEGSCDTYISQALARRRSNSGG